jgi:hypothetical protein
MVHSRASSPIVPASEGMAFMRALETSTTEVCGAAVATERPANQKSVEGIVKATGSPDAAATMFYALSSAQQTIAGLDGAMAVRAAVKPKPDNAPGVTPPPMQVASTGGNKWQGLPGVSTQPKAPGENSA